MQSPESHGSATLSIHRAFVVHFYACAGSADGRISGRVEHVVTGKGDEFQSAGELLQFMRRVLNTGAHERP
jgi:hypothetical protein